MRVALDVSEAEELEVSALLDAVSSALPDADSATLLEAVSSALLAVSTAPSVVDVVVTEEDVTVSVVNPVTYTSPAESVEVPRMLT